MDEKRLVAILLAFFAGGIGVQEFYLKRTARGVLSILFCWTAIPVFVGFFQAIIWAFQSNEEFKRNHTEIYN